MKLSRTLTHGLFLVSAVFIFSLFMTGTVYSKDEVKLTPEFLASNNWDLENGCDIEIKFTGDGRFTIIQRCGNSAETDYINISGGFKINGDKITLTVESAEEMSEIKKGKSLQGVLVKKNNLKYRWCLDFKDFTIWNINILTAAGDAASINGIAAVTMGVKTASTTTVIKVREAPGASAKEINFECGDNDETIKSLGKGKSLTVLARTKDKDKVGKWNNYWYYVEYKKCEFDDGFSRGWVFGEFVKVE